MPKKEKETGQEKTAFSPEEWLRTAIERISKEPWGSGVLLIANQLVVELVRIGESSDIMVRIRTGNMKNAIKLTRREHIDSLLELAEAIIANKNHIQDKLDAVRERLPSGAIRTKYEEL